MTRGRVKMQKTATPESYSEYELCNSGHSGVVSRFALQEVSCKLTIHGSISISHASCLPCHLDLPDTISCSNHCMVNVILSYYH